VRYVMSWGGSSMHLIKSKWIKGWASDKVEQTTSSLENFAKTKIYKGEKLKKRCSCTESLKYFFKYLEHWHQQWLTTWAPDILSQTSCSKNSSCVHFGDILILFLIFTHFSSAKVIHPSINVLVTVRFCLFLQVQNMGDGRPVSVCPRCSHQPIAVQSLWRWNHVPTRHCQSHRGYKGKSLPAYCIMGKWHRERGLSGWHSGKTEWLSPLRFWVHSWSLISNVVERTTLWQIRLTPWVQEGHERSGSSWEVTSCVQMLNLWLYVAFELEHIHLNNGFCIQSYCTTGDLVKQSLNIYFSLQPFIEIREGRHPCIARTFSGGDFIPNDTVVGAKDVSTKSGFLSSSKWEIKVWSLVPGGLFQGELKILHGGFKKRPGPLYLVGLFQGRLKILYGGGGALRRALSVPSACGHVNILWTRSKYHQII
jgi:hypothetical protein